MRGEERKARNSACLQYQYLHIQDVFGFKGPDIIMYYVHTSKFYNRTSLYKDKGEIIRDVFFDGLIKEYSYNTKTKSAATSMHT